MPTKSVPGLVSLSGLLILSACGFDAAPGDGGGDAAPVVCTDTFSHTIGDPMGHPAPLGAAAGEARAGRVTAGDLPAHPSGLLTWSAGDYVVANSKIAVVIEDVGVSDGYSPFGGGIVGVARVAGGAMVEPADFSEFAIGVGRFIVDARNVSVINDGTDGNAAVVRAVGNLAFLPFIEELVSALVPGEFAHLDVAADYILEPDAEHVLVRYTFANSSVNASRVRLPLLFAIQGNRMPTFVPGLGFGDTVGMDVPFMAFAQEGSTAYAVRAPAGDLSVFLEISGVLLLSAPPYVVPPCSISTQDLATVTVGGPGLDALLSVVARQAGNSQRTITGTVTNYDATPAQGARVHAQATDGSYISRAPTDAAGAYRLRVPDVPVQLTAVRRGNTPVGPVDVPLGTSTADFAFGDTGFIHVTATDAVLGTALPVRIQVVPTVPPVPLPPSFGEVQERNGRLHVAFPVFPVAGDVTLRVPLGTHEVHVSRGYEYELFSTMVTVAAGATEPVVAPIAHIVDSTGVMCGDFHIHTFRSVDSEDSPRFKLAGATGDGVEIPVRSDHEWVNGFEPEIMAMGLDAFAYGIASLELTTLAWGHFGVFPLDPLPDEPSGGAFLWAGRTPGDVFAEVRARTTSFGQPAIIVNHPRSSGPGLQGYFDVAEYSAVTGLPGRPELWDEQFVLVEVFNDSSFDANYDPRGTTPRSVNDWFSFLNAGRRVFAVGSSDTHSLIKSPAGYPRTCIEVGVDTAPELRAIGAGRVRDQLKAGHATINGGIYVTATARGGVGPGGNVLAAMASEMVTVVAQAPVWVAADTLRVFVDGALVETVPLTSATADPMNPTVRFRADLTVNVAPGGSWVVFVASGDMPLAPVHPGRMPFGVTNPIFFVP